MHNAMHRAHALTRRARAEEGDDYDVNFGAALALCHKYAHVGALPSAPAWGRAITRATSSSPVPPPSIARGNPARMREEVPPPPPRTTPDGPYRSFELRFGPDGVDVVTV